MPTRESGYVYAGDKIYYYGQGVYSIPGDFGGVVGRIAGSVVGPQYDYANLASQAIVSRGYKDVSVAGKASGTSYAISAWLVAPVDQASIDDVRDNIDGALSSLPYFSLKTSMTQNTTSDPASGLVRPALPVVAPNSDVSSSGGSTNILDELSKMMNNAAPVAVKNLFAGLGISLPVVALGAGVLIFIIISSRK
jgi:hypothetical protein